MKEKILKLKKIFCWVIYTALKNTPAKSYPTTEEIKDTLDLISKLEVLVEDYLKMSKKVDPIIEEYTKKAKGLSEEEKNVLLKERKEKIDEVNIEFSDYNKEHSADICEIKLGEGAIKTLKTQFEREGWGKTWVVNIQEFGELIDCFEEAEKEAN